MGVFGARCADEDALPANTLVLAAPDGALHRYRKIHPFSYSGEHERYQAGDVFLSLDVDGVRCSFFVLRPALRRRVLAAGAGTDCYVVPANWARGAP